MENVKINPHKMDKRNKPTVSQPITGGVDKEKNQMVVPIPNDWKTAPGFGACIKRYISATSRVQTQFYCYPANSGEKAKYATNGEPHVLYSPSKPIGVNELRNHFKYGAELLGLSNPVDFGGHAYRALVTTALHSDPNVSTEAALGACRHGSYGASRTYQQASAQQQMAVLNAVNLLPRHVQHNPQEQQPPTVQQQQQQPAVQAQHIVQDQRIVHAQPQPVHSQSIVQAQPQPVHSQPFVQGPVVQAQPFVQGPPVFPVQPVSNFFPVQPQVLPYVQQQQYTLGAPAPMQPYCHGQGQVVAPNQFGTFASVPSQQQHQQQQH